MSRIAEQAYGDQPAAYPSSPGWKESTTSRAAAASVASGAVDLRQRVYRVIHDASENGATADEVAKIMGISIWTIRPRVSELRSKKSIVNKPGHTRKNDSGRSAKVWRTSSDYPGK